jgi:hypothetical protein
VGRIPPTKQVINFCGGWISPGFEPNNSQSTDETL